MRRWIGRVGGIALAGLAGPLLAACASLLGIDELPVDGRATIDAIDSPLAEAGPADATADACPDATSYCTLFCPPPPFCDDFEGIDDPAARWNSPSVNNPVLFNDASLRLERLDGGNQILFAQAAATEGNLGAALLVTTVRRATKPAGIHVTAKIRLRSIDVLPDADQILRGVSIVIVGHHVANHGVGVGIVADESGKGRVVLFESDLLGEDPAVVMLQDVVAGPLSAIIQNALPVDVYVAPPSVLRARGLPCEPSDAGDAGPEALHVVVARFDQPQPCLAMPPVLRSGDWLDAATILAGAAVEDFANAAVQVDDVALFALE